MFLGNRYAILVFQQILPILYLIQEGFDWVQLVLNCLLRACIYFPLLLNKFLHWNSWFRFHIILYKSDQLIQYSVVPPGVSLISKSYLTGSEDMLQCLWFVITQRIGRIAFFFPFKKIVFRRKLLYIERIKKLNLKGAIGHISFQVIDFCKVFSQFVHWPCWDRWTPFRNLLLSSSLLTFWMTISQ